MPDREQSVARELERAQAAIERLYAELLEKDKQIAALKARLAEQNKEIDWCPFLKT
jgi:peptidoglycan hydrolase CwlO-like protein